MTESERQEALDVLIEREVDQLMDAEVAKRRAALRQEVRDKYNREAFERRMARINAHHPIEDPPSAAEQAARDAQCEASRKAMVERREANAERYAREEAARQQRHREHFAAKR